MTIGFTSVAAGAPLIKDHAYTVAGVFRNTSGVVTSILLYNPWGSDGAGIDWNDDGYVSVTPEQLFGSTGDFRWGKV